MSATHGPRAQHERSGRFTAEADAEVAAADLPVDRYRLAEQFYVCHPGEGWHSYGASELAFLRWEVHRGVLNPPEGDHPGSPWWRSVNAGLLRDATEARLLHEAGDGSPGSTAGVQAWQRFLAAPSATCLLYTSPSPRD